MGIIKDELRKRKEDQRRRKKNTRWCCREWRGIEDGYDEASKISRALLRSNGVWVCSFGGAIVQPARIEASTKTLGNKNSHVASQFVYEVSLRHRRFVYVPDIIFD